MRRLIRVRVTGALPILTVALPLVALCAGCGATPSDGNNNDNGGGNVVGTGNATVTGTVVDAANPTEGVADAYVFVPFTARAAGVDASARQSALAATTSEGNGSYTLQGVPSGSRTIVIHPPEELGYAEMEVDLDIPDSASIELRITLAKSSVAGDVGAVAVAPATAELGVGETRQFTATVFNASGQEMSLAPVWVANGDIGTVDENGLFTATAAGSGYVVAVVAGKLGTSQVTTVEGTAGVTDAELEAVLRQALSKPTGPLMIDDLEGMTGTLEAQNQGIRSLDGLQHCIRVTDLYLNDNLIVDVSPLASLTTLRDLNLDGNQVTDISPLSALTGLDALDVGGNRVTDAGPLASLGNLTYLGAGANNIADASPIAGLTKLRELWLNGNQLTNVSWLSALTNLRILSVAGNSISDVSFLSALVNLRELELRQNEISDISAIASLVNLTHLDIGGNQAADISALSSLTNLTNLQVWGNGISDISPLAGLANLTLLGVYTNQITNITPLADLVNLTWLGVADNAVSDISPLAGLTGLDELYLFGNEIVDISPLQSLTGLSLLELQDNQIVDISALVANAGLGSGDAVDLSGNPLDLASGSQTGQDIVTLQGRGVAVQF